MTKILVSDYDRTLITNSKVTSLKINKSAIDEFRSNGNCFVINTARPYDSIKKELTKNHISYDYLVCDNGAVTFNHLDKIIKINNLDIKNTEKIINFLKKYAGWNYTFYYDAYGKATNHLSDINLNLLTDIVCFSGNPDLARHLNSNTMFNREFYCRNYLFMNVIKERKVNKAYGIEPIINEIKNNDYIEGVYTIGDSIDDLSMLKKYNGYKMLFSSPSLYAQNIPTVTSVKQLINKIEKV